jgi:hypothetical protein
MKTIIGVLAAFACVIGVARYRRHQADERETARIAADREAQRRVDSTIQVEHDRAVAVARDDSMRAARLNAVRDAHLITRTGIPVKPARP